MKKMQQERMYSSYFCFFSWEYCTRLLLSTVFIIACAWLQYTISRYNDIFNTHTAVGDTLINIIPASDLSFLFLTGMWIFVLVWSGYILWKMPERIPFILFSFGIFFLVRGLCIGATHLGVPTGYITPTMNGVEIVHFFRNDLFFSGHTGVPFLAALLSWNDTKWRYGFLITSIIMAYTVLSMRLHYTIDIIGAYFITYGIYRIAVKSAYTSRQYLVKYQREKIKNNSPSTRTSAGPV